MTTAEQKKILVVDDSPDNLNLLSELLKPFYRVQAAINGKRALALLQKSQKPDMILLDIMMPEMDGYEVCEKIKSDPGLADIPVIFISAKNLVTDEEKGLSLGAVDYIAKPIQPMLVLARIKNHLALYDQARHLEDLVQRRTKDIHDTRLEIIKVLGRAAEYKDNETGMHVIRMSCYANVIAKSMGLDESWCDLLLQAAPMHDIGKIGIPDEILLKPGKLDQQEWEAMKKHAEFGASIIGEHKSPLLALARQVALYHHEKWDGSGYPEGLREKDIPLAARIVAVADVFDALTTARPYKAAWPVEQAIEHIKNQSGCHFDPDIVEHFIKCLPEILTLKEKYKENSL